jgi:hypothetical protein
MNEQLPEVHKPNGAEKTATAARPVPSGRLRTFQQALDHLGAVSPWKLRQLVLSGQLPVVLLDETEGSKWRFDVADLDGLIARHKKLL